jgi:hypothetical protein
MCCSRFTDEKTRVVMEGTSGARTKSTLFALWPHGSPFARLDKDEQVATGKRIGALVASARAEAAGDEGKAWRAAVEASEHDTDFYLHPISYGAAVVFDDGSVARACQDKALEYGCSQDAVCQLVPAIEAARARGHKPTIVCMADQFGVCHAPSAPARAFLVARGHNTVRVLAHDEHGQLHTPTATALLPASFKFPVLKREEADAKAPEEQSSRACLPCMSPGGLRFLATHAPPVSADGSPLATTPAARRARDGERKPTAPPPSFRLPDSLVAGP